MNRFCIVLGILVVIFQNMVFWQTMLPQKMHQNNVCIEIINMMDHAAIPAHHHISSEKSSIAHPTKSNASMDCHFCQLFHASLPVSLLSPKLIENKLLIKIIFLAISAYTFFYLQRLFLSPQGRGPPHIPVFA